MNTQELIKLLQQQVKFWNSLCDKLFLEKVVTGEWKETNTVYNYCLNKYNDKLTELGHL